MTNQINAHPASQDPGPATPEQIEAFYDACLNVSQHIRSELSGQRDSVYEFSLPTTDTRLTDLLPYFQPLPEQVPPQKNRRFDIICDIEHDDSAAWLYPGTLLTELTISHHTEDADETSENYFQEQLALTVMRVEATDALQLFESYEVCGRYEEYGLTYRDDWETDALIPSSQHLARAAMALVNSLTLEDQLAVKDPEIDEED